MSDLPVLNEVLLEKTLEVIEAHPEHWNQGTWRVDVPPAGAIVSSQRRYLHGLTPLACGTAYCFAGWAVQLHGSVREWVDGETLALEDGGLVRVDVYAQHLLGLTHREAKSLFFPLNDLTALRAQVGALLEGDRIRDRDL